MKNSLIAPLILGGVVVVAVAVAGFDVTYMLDGKQGAVRMDHGPGKRIRVENGELDLTRT